MITSTRKNYLDLVRLIAIFFVLFNHTGERGFHLFTCRTESAWFPLYLFLSVLTKIAVPLFFMASGAVLLEKEEATSELLRKRFIKYLVSLVVFSWVVYLYDCVAGRIENASAVDYLKKLYSHKISNHFWYMYTYLAYVLMLPVIRKLAKSLSRNNFKWMIAMYAIAQLIPMIEFVAFKGNLTMTNFFRFFITTNYLWYPLMGYYLDKTGDDCPDSSLIGMACISISAIIFTCFVTEYRCTVLNNWNGASTEQFFNNLIFVPAGTVFCCAKRFLKKHNVSEEVGKNLKVLGGLTFGIYLLEPIYRNVTDTIYYILEPMIGSLLACLIWIFFACICGGIVTYVLKRVPGIRKII